jgi:hypothetical protein
MKMRYLWFIGGALLGFLVGAFSIPLQASDENGDVFCLAQNIYFESANQPLAGKIAVAQVVQNRVVHPSYPDTICDVNKLEGTKCSCFKQVSVQLVL